jgi:hypothetical protein
MGPLIYLTLTSFNGFISDGDFSWSTPNEDLMAALNANLSEGGTYPLLAADARDDGRVEDRSRAGRAVASI